MIINPASSYRWFVRLRNTFLQRCIVVCMHRLEVVELSLRAAMTMSGRNASPDSSPVAMSGMLEQGLSCGSSSKLKSSAMLNTSRATGFIARLASAQRWLRTMSCIAAVDKPEPVGIKFCLQIVPAHVRWKKPRPFFEQSPASSS